MSLSLTTGSCRVWQPIIVFWLYFWRAVGKCCWWGLCSGARIQNTSNNMSYGHFAATPLTGNWKTVADLVQLSVSLRSTGLLHRSSTSREEEIVLGARKHGICHGLYVSLCVFASVDGFSFPLDLEIFVDHDPSKGASLVDFNSNVFVCNLEVSFLCFPWQWLCANQLVFRLFQSSKEYRCVDIYQAHFPQTIVGLADEMRIVKCRNLRTTSIFQYV